MWNKPGVMGTEEWHVIVLQDSSEVWNGKHHPPRTERRLPEWAGQTIELHRSDKSVNTCTLSHAGVSAKPLVGTWFQNKIPHLFALASKLPKEFSLCMDAYLITILQGLWHLHMSVYICLPVCLSTNFSYTSLNWFQSNLSWTVRSSHSVIYLRSWQLCKLNLLQTSIRLLAPTPFTDPNQIWHEPSKPFTSPLISV